MKRRNALLGLGVIIIFAVLTLPLWVAFTAWMFRLAQSWGWLP
jgi:hypothetical protein